MQRGLDLVDQEGNSPRKMAGRHAALTSTGQELTIRDLDTPGGTFVNQQRLLAGQARRLAPGDVIQLGGVQLRVKQTGAAPSAAPRGIGESAAPAGKAVPWQYPSRHRPGKRYPRQYPSRHRPGKRYLGSTRRGAGRESGTLGSTHRGTGREGRALSNTCRGAGCEGGPSAAPAAAPAKAAVPTPKPVAPAVASPPTPGRLTTPFSLAGGAQCRTWDDFLVLAAQSWPALRDELTSGRLAEFLRRIHRPDLVPLAGSLPIAR